MRVLVTGGTGFVGQEVVRALLTAAQDPVVLSRHRPKNLDTRCRWQAGDVLNKPALVSAAAGAEAVIHLVGIISECGESTFENIHARGTANVVGAAQSGGARIFVHMSALGTRPGAVSRYHKSKWAGEESVRSSGLPYTIFRPSLIYGPGDHFVNLYAGMSRFSPVLPLLGRPDAKFQPVLARDVAKAFAGALSEPAAVGQTISLTGKELLTLRQIVGTIMEVLGRKRMLLQVPRGLATLQARILEWVYPALLRTAPPLNRDQLLMLQEDNIGDSAEAPRLFELEQPSFKQGISEYLQPR
jgi:NADH dehydrogenase